MEVTRSSPEADASYAGMRGIRIAVLRLGDISDHLFDFYFDMLSSFKMIGGDDVAGVGNPRLFPPPDPLPLKYNKRALSCGVLQLNWVKDAVPSPWQDLMGHRKVLAAVALVHGARYDEAKFKELLKTFESIEGKVYRTMYLVIAPSEAGYSDTNVYKTKHICLIPWCKRAATMQMLQAAVHELLLDILATIHRNIHSSTPLVLTTPEDPPGVKQREDVQKARRAKHVADLCLLLCDYESAERYYSELKDNLALSGLWKGAACEGAACALSQTISNTLPAEVQRQKMKKVVWYHEEALEHYDQATDPNVRILQAEACIRLAQLQIQCGSQRDEVLSTVMSGYSIASTIQDQVPIIRRLAQLCVSVGYHRKAAFLLRSLACIEKTKVRYFDALRTYVVAAQLVHIPIELNHRGQLVAKGGDTGKGWHHLQLTLVKEMMQVAVELKNTQGESGYFYQLSLYALMRYAGILDQQWQTSCLKDLTHDMHGVPSLRPFPLLQSITPLPLVPHLRPVIQRVKKGLNIFTHNPYLKDKAGPEITWVKGATGEVSIVLSNPLKVPLPLSSIGVTVENIAARLFTQSETLQGQSQHTVTIGVHPLTAGTLKITNVEIILSPMPLQPFLIPIEPPLAITVINEIPVLGLSVTDRLAHRHTIPMYPSDKVTFPVNLRNIGVLPVEYLSLSVLNDSQGTPPRLQIAYDASLLKLPLLPGAALIIDVTITTPPVFDGPTEYNLRLQATYGAAEHTDTPDTTHSTDVEHYEVSVLSRRQVEVPLSVEVTPGATIDMTINTDCGRFLMVSLSNRAPTAITLHNTPYSSRGVDGTPFFLSLDAPPFTTAPQGKFIVEAPPSYGPAPRQFVVRSGASASIVIPYHHIPDRDALRMSIPWSAPGGHGGLLGLSPPPVSSSPKSPISLITSVPSSPAHNEGVLRALPPLPVEPDILAVEVKLEEVEVEEPCDAQSLVSLTTFLDAGEKAPLVVKQHALYRVAVSLIPMVQRDPSSSPPVSPSSSASPPAPPTPKEVKIGFAIRGSLHSSIQPLGLDNTFSYEGVLETPSLPVDPMREVVWEQRYPTTQSAGIQNHYTWEVVGDEGDAEPPTHDFLIAVRSPGIFLLQVQVSDPASSARYLHHFAIRCVNPYLGV
eukprot:Sspe_Gene.19907::Locus_7280_Transcript_1_1_Confidence_1.000_Length_3470::g.19907::m.19907/K20306/TRAPPC9, TRS120; trafficking protein particle complex subunit 9